MATIEGRKSVAQSRPSCLPLRFLNDCHSHFVPGLATMVDETPGNYQVARPTPDGMRDVGIKPPRVSLESYVRPANNPGGDAFGTFQPVRRQA
jgi:hypothetical protein